MPEAIKRIPYAIADYRQMREENGYYVDKTHFIPLLEAAPPGEKVIQGFLLAYINLTHYFLLWSEKEMGGGFVDFYLEPFWARYPDMGYGYLVELEYISRADYSAERLQKEIAEAEAQLKQYANDPRIQKVAAQVPLKKLVLVYSGWELVYREEWVEGR